MVKSYSGEKYKRPKEIMESSIPMPTTSSFKISLALFVKKKKNSQKDNLFLVYKYMKKKRNIESTKNDSRWDYLNKPTQINWMEKILNVGYGGDFKKAAQAILGIGEHYERIGYPWDGATVFKKLTDWEEGRLGKS